MTDGIELGLGLFCNREREDQTRVKTLRLGVEVRERERVGLNLAWVLFIMRYDGFLLLLITYVDL